MLSDLSEADARGEIAEIYADVRKFWGVPYVSSIHRHMATRPGLLEWSWAKVAPVFRDGTAQKVAWKLAADVAIAPMPPISRAALRIWGVDEKGEQTAREVCEGFTRVSPVNMVFADLVKRVLLGERPGGQKPSASATWDAPSPLPVPPVLVDMKKISQAEQQVLLQFAKHGDGGAFVPGLYRMLGHWPGLLAHLATNLSPRLASAETLALGDEVRARVDAAVPGVFAHLPDVETSWPAPSDAERQDLFEVMEVYRKTSPEMIIFGRLIHEALPKTG